MNKISVILLSVCITLCSPLSAQQFIFPAKGQTPEQQKKDEYACHSWAVEQTGFDPTVAQPSTIAPVTTPAPAQSARPTRGAGLGGAVGGGTIGAIAEEIDDDVKSNDYAKKGAALGAIASRRGSRRANQAAADQQAQAQAQVQAAQSVSNEQIANYNKARTVCLEAKDYSVK